MALIKFANSIWGKQLSEISGRYFDTMELTHKNKNSLTFRVTGRNTPLSDDYIYLIWNVRNGIYVPHTWIKEDEHKKIHE